MKEKESHNKRFASMAFSSVYPLYLKKIELKNRNKEELDQVINWLTGFDDKKLQELIKNNVTFEEFFKQAKLNNNAHLITGVICGYRIEEIENLLTRKVRYLDKLIDELAKGKAMNKILRKPAIANIRTEDNVPHKIPKDLRQLFLEKPNIFDIWKSLTPLAQNEWICWITIVKKTETRKEHIERLQADLLIGKRRPCCWPGCPHRKLNVEKWFKNKKILDNS